MYEVILSEQDGGRMLIRLQDVVLVRWSGISCSKDVGRVMLAMDRDDATYHFECTLAEFDKLSAALQYVDAKAKIT